LREEFLEPMGLTPYAVARHAASAHGASSVCVREELASAQTPRCGWGVFFRIEPEFAESPTRYDLETTSAAIGRALDRIAGFRSRAA